MFGNAYALFFLSALVGSALTLWALMRAHADEVIAVLRGEQPRLDDAPPRPLFARIRSGRRRAFPLVNFSICRL